MLDDPKAVALRRDIGGWMKENLTGRFEEIKWRGGPGDEDAFPELRKDWERHMGEAGWIGIAWPEEHGGRGAGLLEQVAFNEEYARHGGPGRSGHIGETLVAPTLIAFGSPEQQRQFLPGIKAGEIFWCQGYSEPNAGSDLANVKTKARLTEDGAEWILNGQKIWTSNATESDWCFVLARSEEGSVGRNGLVYLLVPLDQSGVEIRPIIQITGTSEFNETFFDNARTDASNIVGAVGDGWKVAMATLGFERGASTLGQQLLFRNELDEIIRRARANGAASDPLIRQRIAKAYAGLEIMRFHAMRMLSDHDDGHLSNEAYVSKLFWASWHRDLGELAMDVVGPIAETKENGEFDRLQRLFLFSRADTIYGGTNQIQRNIIAERALGMPKEPRGNAPS
ncbi:MAG: acyl-CoA dehydrogenase family protein [Pseudomonadota bacterium]